VVGLGFCKPRHSHHLKRAFARLWGSPNGEIPIENADSTQHTLRFTATDQDITRTNTYTIGLRSEGSIPITDLVPIGREYTLTVELDESSLKTVEWVMCNGRSDNLSVRISKAGELQIDSETARLA
jgi:hypothetical protein